MAESGSWRDEGTVPAEVSSDQLLHDSEAKFHAIAECIDQMIFTAEPDGRHDYFNGRWEAFTGLSLRDMQGIDQNDLVHSDDVEEVLKRTRATLEGGTPFEMEYRLRHRSGAYRWVLGRAQPLRDASGTITRWYGTCTDIHDEVLARDETLARTRQERDLLWNGSRDLFVIISSEGQYRDVNPRWTDVLGYARGELIGRRFDDLAHPGDLDLVREAFAEILAGTPIFDLPVRIAHADGSYRNVEWNVGMENGSVFASGRDITDRLAREAALSASEAALRQSQKLETIGQLTGGVAHDFNNLLMATRSSLDLLSRHIPGDDPRAAELLANAQAATTRGATLTQRMLAFARRQELEADAVDVGALLRDLRELIARSIGPRIDIALDISPGVPKAFVDANQLEMALLNLAVNGRDAMDGDGTLTIRLDHVIVDIRLGVALELDSAPYVRIDVIDTGTGMDLTTLNQAMEPFFTTKETGKGTGLGLSMVHGLAAQSGGTFRIRSAPGEGSTATLYLPVAEVTENISRPLVASEAPDPPAATYPQGLTVLAVDDDALVLMGTAGLLEDMGHTVIEAASGQAAIELFEGHPEIDLVITDHAMPKMTGVELAATLRTRRPDLAVILASGYSEMPEGAKGNIAVRLGKPFGPADLGRAIAAVREGSAD